LKSNGGKRLISIQFTQSQAFVEFFGWFEDADHIFIAMEYFQHGTLNKYITNFLSEKDARIISLQLLEGLKIMHEERFTHRDLKPEVSLLVILSVSKLGADFTRTYSLYRLPWSHKVGG